MRGVPQLHLFIPATPLVLDVQPVQVMQSIKVRYLLPRGPVGVAAQPARLEQLQDDKPEALALGTVEIWLALVWVGFCEPWYVDVECLQGVHHLLCCRVREACEPRDEMRWCSCSGSLQDAVKVVEHVVVDVLRILESLADVGWVVPADDVPEGSLVMPELLSVRHCVRVSDTYLASHDLCAFLVFSFPSLVLSPLSLRC
ncbi:hypothetical protein F5883DRAFT_552779 [Diaporthe sp. PMI_573]|nr:hypothetical protein F5883DRAFT_552779 [Diaporthaceae sp. PMI_573]